MMQDENTNRYDNYEPKDTYYYANGQRIPLVREPRVFAVRYRAGRDARDPRLSRRAFRLLHEESENIGFIPNYGLQLYRTNPAAISRRSDPRAQQQDVIAAVKELGAEAPVEYAAVAYRRNPEAPANRVDDLMFVTHEFVVQFKPDVTRERIDALNAQYGVHIAKTLGYAENGYLLEAPEAEGTRGPVALSNVYYESGLVEFAHPNFIRRRHLRETPMYAQQTPAESTSVTGREHADRAMYLSRQWHLQVAKVVDAWNAVTRGDSSIKVAILDDGIDTGHPEFAGKIAAQFDFASGNADGSPNSNGDNHGTACAGVAVAKGARALGAAPDCSLIAVRYPDFLGVAEEAEMFRWAADQRADVISCSWGPADGTGAVDPLPDNVRAAIRYCVTQGRNGLGIPIFWAAGNGNESVSNDGYASNPDVMAVAASTSDERRSWYSDFGPEIFICAPSSGDSSLGEQRIFTVDRRGDHGYNPDPDTGVSHPPDDRDYTDDFGGTSSATPLVAGIAGLMLSVNPNLRVQDVRQILRETADKIDPSGGDYDGNGHSRFYGYGRVNALRAVERARDFDSAGSTPAALDQPSIRGPATLNRSDAPPTFDIDTGGRRLYAVEVATRAELFDNGAHGSERNANNFYGSWQDGLLSGTPYTLPAAVWERLKQAERLFYRLHVADDNTWSNYGVTVPDSQAGSAPSMQIVGGPGPSGGGLDGGATTTPRTVTFPSGATFEVIETPLDGVDYSDHVGNGTVPLIEVRGRMEENLSRNFQVKELAATDGVRYARISVELVEGLQRIRDRVGAAVKVNSGYRHPTLNAAVGGVGNSQHIAGRAADIRTAAMRPLELARIALEELGCDIGIGLGRNSIHVDLRGRLASWRYDGAELSENEFDQWVRDTCQQLGRRRTTRVEYTERVVPTITGPERHAVNDEAPAFHIDPGLNPYYAVEVATHPDLFDRRYEAERTPGNFYGSWTVEGLREARGSTTYTLPEEVWRRLRTAERLYYRVVTSSAASAWSDVHASTPDPQAADAPWIELLGGRQDREEAATIPRLDLRTTRKAEEALWRGG